MIEKVTVHVRILKYKHFLAQVYTPNWSGAVFLIKKV